MEPFALDFETERFGPGNMAPRPVCLSWAQGTESGVVHWSEARDIVEKAITGDGPVVSANMAYDMGVAASAWPDLVPKIFNAYERGVMSDVQIRQKLIDIASGEVRRHRYSLAALAKRYWGTEVDKGEDTWRLRYAELRDLPINEWPPAAVEYARKDAELHRDTWLFQQHELTVDNILDVVHDEPAQARAHFALHLMSAWGLITDAKGVADLRRICEERMEQLKGGLAEEGLLALKTKKGTEWTRKVRVAQQRMLDLLKWEGVSLTTKGKEVKKERGERSEWQQVKYVCVDSEACRDSGDTLLAEYAEYAATSNLLGGHVVAMEKGIEAPIHSRFEVLMETGRTSSSGPNVQNIRRAPGARECFIARPGQVFVDIDYDGAELHTLAQVCINTFGRSVLADALNEGYDPHLGLGARLADTDYEKAKRLLAKGDAGIKSWRQRAKVANFGFPGGLGPKTMVAYAKSNYGVVMDLRDAEELRDEWRAQWPVISLEYLPWIGELCQATGYAWVEHYVSKRRRGNISYTKAANTFFQGLAADAAKAAVFAVSKRCYVKHPGSALFGCRLVNFIHDELLLEAPEARSSDAAWEMRDLMVETYNKYVPDVPVSATPALMRRWSKGAETIIDGNGNLQVWEAA